MRVVFNLAGAIAQSQDGDPLIVVEGVFGVFWLHQNGYRSTVATFGSNMSDAQASLLLGSGRPIVLLCDGDEAGRAGARIAAAKLVTKTSVSVVTLPEGVQPDDLSGLELAEILPM